MRAEAKLVLSMPNTVKIYEVTVTVTLNDGRVFEKTIAKSWE
jgi:hypothetical protein